MYGAFTYMNDHEWLLFILGEVETLSSNTILTGLHNLEILTPQNMNLGHLSSLTSNQRFEKHGLGDFPILPVHTLMLQPKY